jgi:RNA polymerase sigma-70 factor (ECF subfamily)
VPSSSHSNGLGTIISTPLTTSRSRTPADELLVRSGESDRAAFAEFYDLTISRVFAIVRRCLVDTAQSEEVTQDIYLEVWQTAARYDPDRAGAVAWLLTIAHRRAVDRVRASQSSRDRDLKIGIRDMPQDFDSVSENVEISLEHSRATRALSEITDLQREVIDLAYYQGLSQNEIALMLGVSVGTVKTRLRDGLIRLRRVMSEAS